MEYIPKSTKNDDLIFITGSDAGIKSTDHLQRVNTVLPPIIHKTNKFSKMRDLIQNTNIDKDV